MDQVSSVSVCGGGEDSGKGDEVTLGAADKVDIDAVSLRCKDTSGTHALSLNREGGTILRVGRDMVCLRREWGHCERETHLFISE
jgi:hypothetical protein